MDLSKVYKALKFYVQTVDEAEMENIFAMWRDIPRYHYTGKSDYSADKAKRDLLSAKAKGIVGHDRTLLTN